LVARAEQNARLGGEAPDQWLRYGAAAAGFLDLSGHDRVIGLYLAAAFADPVGKNAGPIPFTEQILLGGNAPLRGFLEGRLVDRSALIAKLEYTWPVWVLLDGTLSMEAGNVFDRHLSNFEPELARLSFTMGVRAHGRRDQPFEALVGVGTKPLEEGGEIDSFRVVFGANHGF
jgi:outer membrane protein assembly factor BamA